MILRIQNLAIAFGTKQVLRGVSFGLQPGETVAVMGPNGAGKTTLLRCILGLLNYRGTIEVSGFDAQRRGVEARRRIGYVPQVAAFYDMTARDALGFVAKIRGVAVGRRDDVLRRVGLDGDANRPVAVFSGGMQRRLSLAMALLDDPPLLLLDEPTTNLDAEARGDLLRVLQQFKAAGKTLLISTHRPREVRGLADRVIRIRDGVIEADGPADRLLEAEPIGICVKVNTPEEKLKLADLLLPLGVRSLTTSNGTYEAVLAHDKVVDALELLRNDGVASDRIAVRPLEPGGES
ncbi:MAG TPA: ABC transporter ATP-binding protein [Planctomycetota bacterium]|nr:ABC transporter ATP-binding protein [Planctomycetota bacterium]